MGDHQSSLQALAGHARGGTGAAPGHRRAEVGLLRQSRHEGEHHGGTGRHHHGERQHPAVQRDGRRQRGEPRGVRHEEAQAGGGQHHAERGAGKRHDGVLDEQQAAQRPALSPQHRPHGQLALAANAPGEREVGHVRAGDDENERRRADQDEQREARVAREFLFERRHGDAHRRTRDVHLRVFREQVLRDAVQLHLGGVDGRSRRQAGEHLRHAMIAVESHGRADVMRTGHGVDQHVGALRIIGDGFEHAHDGDGAAVHAHRLSEDRRVAAERALPEVVGEDHDGIGALRIVRGVEAAAEHGLQSHHIEIIARDDARAHPSGLPVAQHGEREGGELGDGLQRLRRRAIVLNLGHRERDVGNRRDGVGLSQVDDAVAAVVGQGTQQHAANDAEDRGVGTDAEADGHYEGEGEAGCLAEPADRVLEFA